MAPKLLDAPPNITHRTTPTPPGRDRQNGMAVLVKVCNVCPAGRGPRDPVSSRIIVDVQRPRFGLEPQSAGALRRGAALVLRIGRLRSGYASRHHVRNDPETAQRPREPRPRQRGHGQSWLGSVRIRRVATTVGSWLTASRSDRLCAACTTSSGTHSGKRCSHTRWAPELVCSLWMAANRSREEVDRRHGPGRATSGGR